MFESKETKQTTVLGKTFNSEEERRTYFREELRKYLPELKKMEGYPIGEDEDILNLSDPPFYTACPNPWLNYFIEEWEEEKKELEKDGKRDAYFVVDEPYSTDVSVGKKNPIYNTHSYHTKVPHPAIMRYLLHYTEPGDIIFDGFAGTGMSAIAANLCAKPILKDKQNIELDFKNLGLKEPKWGERKAIMSDLSPLASNIAYGYNKKNDDYRLRCYLELFLDKFEKKWSDLYQTNHTNNRKGRINFTVWSEVNYCPNCSHEFLFYDESVDFETKKVKSTINCPKCDIELTKKIIGRLTKTKYDKIINKTIKQNIYKPVLINYSIDRKSYNKKPDSVDLDIYEKVDNLTIDNFFPIKELIDGDKTGDPKNVNINNLHQFYLKRQLLVLSDLYQDIKSDKSEFREKLLFGFTGVLPGESKLNRFIRIGTSFPFYLLSGTLFIGSMIRENNILKDYRNKLILRIVKSNSLINKNMNLFGVNSASSHKLNSNSIDYIFTDPPFGKNLMYSELNFLTENWLKVITNNNLEAIENRSQGKSLPHYQAIMLRCFLEYFRILKQGKWMTVEFSNTSAAVWNSIQTALNNSGFIIANVTALDKEQGSFNAVNSPTAVKQDLVISCYKPSSEFDEKFKQHKNTDVAIWDFVEEHLHHLPVHLVVGNSTTAIIERSPKILFDRLIAFYVQKGLPVPLDASRFQQSLRERFIERDGMFFTNEQVQEYDKKKKEKPEFIQLSILVSSEQDGVLWLKNALIETSLTYQDIQPQWMQVLVGVRKGDVIPELATILEENFLKDDAGKWYAPDPENEADLEKLRTKRLLKQFDIYKEEAIKPKTKKIKEVRVEALRAGFKQCYQDKDFKSIVTIGDKIPNNLLMEDEVLLQFYDIASSRV